MTISYFSISLILGLINIKKIFSLLFRSVSLKSNVFTKQDFKCTRITGMASANNVYSELVISFQVRTYYTLIYVEERKKKIKRKKRNNFVIAGWNVVYSGNKKSEHPVPANVRLNSEAQLYLRALPVYFPAIVAAITMRFIVITTFTSQLHPRSFFDHLSRHRVPCPSAFSCSFPHSFLCLLSFLSTSSKIINLTFDLAHVHQNELVSRIPFLAHY